MSGIDLNKSDLIEQRAALQPVGAYATTVDAAVGEGTGNLIYKINFRDPNQLGSIVYTKYTLYGGADAPAFPTDEATDTDKPVDVSDSWSPAYSSVVHTTLTLVNGVSQSIAANPNRVGYESRTQPLNGGAGIALLLIGETYVPTNTQWTHSMVRTKDITTTPNAQVLNFTTFQPCVGSLNFLAQTGAGDVEILEFIR